MTEYQIVKKFYGSQKAKRSGVPLINHIDEGLLILSHIQANDTAKIIVNHFTGDYETAE